MSVLVTGGAGYVGSHMVHQLLDAGEEVVVLDNLSTGFSWVVPDAARLVVGDVGDAGLVRLVLTEKEVDAIIHFAASIVVPESVDNPLAYYPNNTCSCRTLIQCAVDAGVKHFIFSSTAAVYGAQESIPVPEDAPLKPISPYGRSKLMAETILQDAGRAHDLRYVTLRYFNVAGADPSGRTGQSRPHSTHLIEVALEAALGKRPFLEVFGTDYATPDGTCLRDYIHETDLIRAHLAALKYLREGGESQILNCGYGRGFSVLEVIEAVKTVTGSKFEVRRGPRRLGDPAMLTADTRRIFEVLDWHTNYADFETIVGNALSWQRKLMIRHDA